MRKVSGLILGLFLVLTAAFAADEVKTEELKTAKVLAVKKYAEGRIVRWEGRVAIYDGYPFYDITLLLDNKKYVVRYESMSGYYPARWDAGNEIKVRSAGKGKMYLLNGAEEVQVGIFNAKAQNCVFANGPPVTLDPSPQVPCQ
jgi:hypothetical protein